MQKKKRYLLYVKLSSLGLYILLCMTMFKDIEERLINKLEITEFWGMLIAGIGLGISVIIYIVRLMDEKSKDSLSNVHIGCMVLLVLIIINLMDARIVSIIFYFVLRFTLGWIYQYLYSAIFVWMAGLFWKITIGIILVVVLLALYFGAMFLIANPKWPVLVFVGEVLRFIGECMKPDGESQKSSSSSGGGVSIGEIIDAYETDRQRDNIRRAADELEKIRFELTNR